MKKILVLFLTATIIFAFSGCGNGNSENAATITLKDGTTEELTCKELKKTYDTNEAKFEKYEGAPITFVGTVKSVKTYFRESGCSYLLDSIEFKEGWTVYLAYGAYDNILEKLDEGTKVKVKSNIYSGFGMGINIRGTSSDFYASYSEESLRKTVLTIVE